MLPDAFHSNIDKLRGRRFLPAAIALRLFLRARPHSRVRAMQSWSSPCFSSAGERESCWPQYFPAPFDRVRCSSRFDREPANKFPAATARVEVLDSERCALRRYSRARRAEAANLRLTERFAEHPAAEARLSAKPPSTESAWFQLARDKVNPRL